MAKKTIKKVGDKLEVTVEKVTTISKGELQQKQAGLENEIAVLEAALDEVKEQMAVLG